MLSGLTLSKLAAYEKVLQHNTSLVDYYRKKKVNKYILPLIDLNNKSFGSIVEQIIIEHLGCVKSKTSVYDCSMKIGNKTIKFEQKSSRYWRALEDFKWQHIILDHPYDALILVGIDFQEIKIYVISKKEIIELHKEGIIKNQGGGNKGNGQGVWFSRKQVQDYLIELKSLQDFENFCKRI
jgi:hypothetical protein